MSGWEFIGRMRFSGVSYDDLPSPHNTTARRCVHACLRAGEAIPADVIDALDAGIQRAAERRAYSCPV